MNILNKSPKLKDYLASVGLSTVQNFVSLIRNPLILAPESAKVPGIFSVSNNNSLLRTYLINDSKLGLAEQIRVASGTPLTISVIPVADGDTTGVWNNGKTTKFTLNGKSAVAKVIMSSVGEYSLKSPVSSLPLMINVVLTPSSDNNQTAGSGGSGSWFSKVLGWFNK